MSTLNFDKMRQETTWSFPVEPALHVEQPAGFRSASRTSPEYWRLIQQVTVTLSIAPDGERYWYTQAIGIAATKAGAPRGTYTGTVYGPEAEALEEQAQQYVVEQLDSP